MGMSAAHAATSTTKEHKPVCIATTSPSSFVESGLYPQESSVAFVITVECKPVYGEQQVELFSPQLYSACHGTLSWAQAAFFPSDTAVDTESFDVTLDNDGNATAVVWGGPSCAAAKVLIQADLTVSPYSTADAYATIAPPHNTKKGLYAYPASEVEDEFTSSVAVTFYAEFPASQAENWVEIGDSQLYDACHGNITWIGPDETILGTDVKSVQVQLDDNGNAWVVAIAGPSCAAVPTQATADLFDTPPYTTYTTNFTIKSPRPTNWVPRRTD
jgi:hypothetical protein